MTVLWFPFTRTRKGLVVRTAWFTIRVYPPSVPTFNIWWRKAR